MAHRTPLLLLTGLLFVSTTAAKADSRRPAASDPLVGRRASVAAATVTLPAKGCAGSVVGEPNQVLTAAHCVPAGAIDVAIETPDGTPHLALVAKVDRKRDTALLVLENPLPVRPLAWAVAAPQVGDRVLFVGRVDRPSKTQVSTVERLDRCPSLPGVPDAIFTDLKARPGDSGAPLVDARLRVLGVIHGGSACHIAAPTAGLARQMTGQIPAPGDLAEAPDVPADPEAPALDDPDSRADSDFRADRVSRGVSDSRVLETYRFGPFVLQKLDHGFRFRFHLDIGTDPDSDAESE